MGQGPDQDYFAVDSGISSYVYTMSLLRPSRCERQTATTYIGACARARVCTYSSTCMTLLHLYLQMLVHDKIRFRSSRCGRQTARTCISACACACVCVRMCVSMCACDFTTLVDTYVHTLSGQMQTVQLWAADCNDFSGRSEAVVRIVR